MKKCPRCNNYYSLEDFYKCSYKKDGKQVYCKSCFKELFQNRWSEKSNFIKEKIKLKIKNLRQLANDIKSSKGCLICNEKEAICLDFHHYDDNKLDSVADTILSKNKNKVLAEIEKCVILCSNCHRKLHAGLIQLPSSVVSTENIAPS